MCGPSSSLAGDGLDAGERPAGAIAVAPDGLAQGGCRGRWSRFAAGETPFGLGFRAALGFRIVRAARLFLEFAGFGRGTLFAFAGLPLFA